MDESIELVARWAAVLALITAVALFAGFALDVARINSLQADSLQEVAIIGKIQAWNAVHRR